MLKMVKWLSKILILVYKALHQLLCVLFLQPYLLLFFLFYFAVATTGLLAVECPRHTLTSLATWCYLSQISTWLTLLIPSQRPFFDHSVYKTATSPPLPTPPQSLALLSSTFSFYTIYYQLICMQKHTQIFTFLHYNPNFWGDKLCFVHYYPKPITA